jgi:hypothetical protein
MKVLLIAALIVVPGLIYMYWMYSVRKGDNENLRSRPTLSNEQVFENFYGDSGFDKVKVIELWLEIAQTLNVPSGQLRPTDRFGEDIGRYLVTSDALDVLSHIAGQRLKAKGSSQDLQGIKTVDDYVKILSM